MAPLLSNPATVGAVIYATIHSGRQEQAIMVTTVEGQKELFTRRSFQDAKSACKLARVLFIPIGRTMEKISEQPLDPELPCQPSLPGSSQQNIRFQPESDQS